MRLAVALLNECRLPRRSFADYERDTIPRSAVERKFEIIGEALSQLAKVDDASAARISSYQRIIAFRNVLIHQYAQVDDRLVWGVVEADLPTLSQDIEALLEGGPPD